MTTEERIKRFYVLPVETVRKLQQLANYHENTLSNQIVEMVDKEFEEIGKFRLDDVVRREDA